MSQSFEWARLIADIISGKDLDYDSSYWMMDQVMSGELGESRLASFLTAMVIKKPTVSEIRGLADAMQDHAVSVDLPTDALDIVGTGGDGYKTVNISTMSAIVLASLGTPLIKHGNRASTSQSGSADVMEALGVNLNHETERMREIFDELNIAFLFANKVHPSMRFAAPVRRSLAFPTAFNILGPLTNPAKVTSNAIGSSNPTNARLMAGVLADRGASALVFRGKETGLDELSTVDVNEIWEVRDGEVTHSEFDPTEHFDMDPAAIGDLRGGDPDDNAVVVREILLGGGRKAVRDAVALNTAGGLIAYGKAQGVRPDDGSLVERFGVGIQMARDAMNDGRAMNLLNRWIELASA
ncbi:MAG: anthranilate phosphoribosyltransferase [Schaalia turicensis]|nr:anthranilate phosphoribosyltransferase [Schaalia turicensis]